MMKKIIIILLFISSSICASYAEVKVVVHAGSNLTTLSKKELSAIFLGRVKTVHGNVYVTPVILAKGDTHKEFVRTYVKRSPSQFRTYWKKLLYTGQGRPPKRFKTEEELIAYIKKTPGAIGYVSEDTDVSEVKVLKIM